eukprot:Seg6496.2 transcript_id=Seg6496.2/GoldUCD/mRNA.D3Y31 product="hypothetical protein" protein_id=Seg6496.2/GoldUCD/D3Y31
MCTCKYYFDRQEHCIPVTLPHGNSKGKNPEPFQKTRESVKSAMKHASKDVPRKQLVKRLLDEALGPLSVRSFNDHPRNHQQISDFRKSPERDEVVEILDLFKEQQCDPQTAYVRDITIAPEKTVFLANERQLCDLQRFCTRPHIFSVLGVDPTFNIRNFYVTMSTYRHLMLVTSRQVHPVMIGPILMHYGKGFDSSFQLPSNIVRFRRELANIRCFGTGGEVKVSHALKSVFTGGYHLMCDIHMRDNVDSKLSDLRVKGATKKEILNAVFGFSDWERKIKGLSAFT